MIQGPLPLDWTHRKLGILPRIENSCLQLSQPPSEKRLELWLRACVKIPTMANWYFVKLHTHGVQEPNQDVLLGDSMVRFHEELRERTNRDPLFRFHYVTAREMANIALAAESGGRFRSMRPIVPILTSGTLSRHLVIQLIPSEVAQCPRQPSQNSCGCRRNSIQHCNASAAFTITLSTVDGAGTTHTSTVTDNARAIGCPGPVNLASSELTRASGLLDRVTGSSSNSLGGSSPADSLDLEFHLRGRAEFRRNKDADNYRD